MNSHSVIDNQTGQLSRVMRMIRRRCVYMCTITGMRLYERCTRACNARFVRCELISMQHQLGILVETINSIVKLHVKMYD